MDPVLSNTLEIARPDVPREVVEALRGFRRPIVISHVVPDADALGSMLGLSRAWTASGCSASVAIPPGSTSQRLGFLVERAAVAVAGVDDFAAADGFVVVDTARRSRCNVGPDLRETEWSAGRTVVSIDHHAGNTMFADVNWIVPDAGSTAELIYVLLSDLGWPIDGVTASLIYAGILTDTLGFSLPTTTASALYAAGALVALGADVGELGERVYRSQSQSEFALLRIIYDNTRVTADGRIAYSSASYDEIRNAGCTPADIDDQINVPRSLNGVHLAMLFTEGKRGKTRINFRGSGTVIVSELAAEFGGGGHSQAAGAVVDASLDEVIARVMPRASEYLAGFST